MAEVENESPNGQESTVGGNEYADLGKGYAEGASKWVNEVGAEKATDAKFEHLEVVAKASGPEAEARRREMGEWSEAAGRYAEHASEEVNRSGQVAVDGGSTAEGVARRMGDAAQSSAQDGIYDMPGAAAGRYKPRPDGSMEVSGFAVTGHGGIDTHRSPSQFIKSEGASAQQPSTEPVNA